MASINLKSLPFIDEVFLKSPLCQICEYASMFGGTCSLLLNRRLPLNFNVKNSQIVSCSAHKNWLQSLDETFEFIKDSLSSKKMDRS
ncbi:MAG: hypothetical protein ACXAC8_05385 [Candidatus Hodarchaeales archaeon]|jgi:hypothetical protein